MSDLQREREFPFVGNHLCMDFVNTQVIQNGEAVDLLETFDDLMAWSVQAKMLEPATAQEMTRRWRSSGKTDKAFDQAIELRAGLREMAERSARGQKAAGQALLDGINDVLRARIGHAEIVKARSGYEMRNHVELTEPIHLLVPVAESAADLLSHGDPTLIRKCQNPECILYFYDTTKNHARRWCSMSGCGNRAKVAAHYRRQRRARTVT